MDGLINDFVRNTIIEENFDDILGQDDVKKELKSALLMGRHIILIGSPGIGKTTLAKNVARILPTIEVVDCGFNCLPKNPVCPNCRSKSDKNDRKTKKISGEERFVLGMPDRLYAHQ